MCYYFLLMKLAERGKRMSHTLSTTQNIIETYTHRLGYNVN